MSLRVSLHKIGLVSGGLLAGLSIGREGPTVQVGAGVMVHARRWLSPQSGIDAHDLMVAGAAAGIAAAFNTPLGGIVFALEQLSRRRSMSHSSLVIASIVLAGLVAVAVFGNETYFGRLRVQELSWTLLGPGLMVALTTGLAGGLFARLIIVSARGLPDRFSRWRRDHPYRFAAGCALAVAVIGLATGGATAGAGYATTRALLEGQADLPGVYTLLKFVATWLSAWTGVPAGVFAPSLAIGAGIGNDVALLSGLGNQEAIPLIALGMVGFLAATTGGPDHGVHHRDGNGVRPGHGAQPDGLQPARQRGGAAGDAADVRRARGDAAGADAIDAATQVISWPSSCRACAGPGRKQVGMPSERINGAELRSAPQVAQPIHVTAR